MRPIESLTYSFIHYYRLDSYRPQGASYMCVYLLFQHRTFYSCNNIKLVFSFYFISIYLFFFIPTMEHVPHCPFAGHNKSEPHSTKWLSANHVTFSLWMREPFQILCVISCWPQCVCVCVDSKSGLQTEGRDQWWCGLNVITIEIIPPPLHPQHVSHNNGVSCFNDRCDYLFQLIEGDSVHAFRNKHGCQHVPLNIYANTTVYTLLYI